MRQRTVQGCDTPLAVLTLSTGCDMFGIGPACCVQSRNTNNKWTDEFNNNNEQISQPNNMVKKHSKNYKTL